MDHSGHYQNLLTSSETKSHCPSQGPSPIPLQDSSSFHHHHHSALLSLPKGKVLFPAKNDLYLLTLPLFHRHKVPPHERREQETHITEVKGRNQKMKGTSKVIMGATLVMVVTLAIVLALILVLLAELYCSLLLRRRKLRNTNSNTLPTTATTATAPSPSHSPRHSPPPPPPFTSIYAQGVLQAPRTVLFPCTEQDMAEPKKQGIHVQTQESNASTLSGIGLVSISPSPLSSFISRAPPKPVHQEKSSEGEEVACGGGGGGEHLVYISNPIYENEEGETSGAANTPFETPESSPSHFERSCSSSGDDDDADAAAAAAADDDEAEQTSPYTPPLTPMKKLPAEGSSVSLRDARSLGTSGSDSRSVNGPSSSSSASPCTSPSW
ncbi:uncharacterized protein LOC130738958 [Lotus japonicus]|uniref:uncharacterized protein LOC130738958 n=1 Tax=Lotus japonicus TaxID=34305 RepID=UPI0025846C74|nr:uncharacterized protein LOC130738958 [Lotus japonicus]